MGLRLLSQGILYDKGIKEKVMEEWGNYQSDEKWVKKWKETMLEEEENKMETTMEKFIKQLINQAENGDMEARTLCVELEKARLQGKNLINKDEFSQVPMPTTCINFKELVLSLLRHQGWTINDVKFSNKGNLESINIKFSSEFALGNSPWDPRLNPVLGPQTLGQNVVGQDPNPKPAPQPRAYVGTP